ncbi:hypothetical protein V9T40_008573 [Parthenolecanium corni]|uniref:Integrase zinc-binding domain-containing protein n=1 Tax=Parthenolecanium corni TaxID=536013 RepID=A0AAN9TLY3_9HEMI
MSVEESDMDSLLHNKRAIVRTLKTLKQYITNKFLKHQSEDVAHQINGFLGSFQEELKKLEETTNEILGVNDIKDLTPDKIEESEAKTKRAVSSLAAQSFDPLGFAAPIVIRAKILLQDLWREGKEWDEPIFPQIEKNFQDHHHKLRNLPKFKIQRLYFTEKVIKYELIGFSEASEKAYGAIIYMKIYCESKIGSIIVCSKSKVAPMKELTIPHIELLGTVLLTKLLVRVSKILRYNISSATAYCDSTIVLAWLKGPSSKYQTFVRNRVEYVTSEISIHQWNYVQTDENPADLLTRGLPVKSIINNSFWIHGPKWLIDKEKKESKIEIPKEIPKMRETCIVSVSEFQMDESLLVLHSNFYKTLRISSLVWKYISRLNQNLNKYESIDLKTQSMNIACHISQSGFFRTDISTLEKGELLSSKSSLRSLSPFVDAYGLLRVGGRLKNSNICYKTRHPIILLRKSILSEILVCHIHEKYFHTTRSFTLGFLQSRFWIHGGASRLVKKVIHNCVLCVRLKAETLTQFARHVVGILLIGIVLSCT